jgi:uncharacterized protein YciI
MLCVAARTGDSYERALRLSNAAWQPARPPSGAPHAGHGGSIRSFNHTMLRAYTEGMFVLELTYTADLSEIDAAMKSHMRWLNAQYAAGHFLVSGRKIPRDGGVILATGSDRASVERIAAEDPFVKQGLATVRVIEFRASQKTADLKRWADAE